MRMILALLALTHLAIAQPLMPAQRSARTSTNGAIMLGWKYGEPMFNTVSNVTLRSQLAAGLFEYYMVWGLQPGSTNTFVVFNSSGLSNPATGVAEPYIPKSEITIYSYLVKVPTKTNGTTRILTSTNLLVWTRLFSVTNAGPTFSFVWTNEGAARFFRAVSP